MKKGAAMPNSKETEAGAAGDELSKAEIEALVWDEYLTPRIEAADRGEIEWIEEDAFFRHAREFRARFKAEQADRNTKA